MEIAPRHEMLLFGLKLTKSLPDSTEEEVNERVKRAAAAARRWREYSRKGADRPPTFKLPETASKAEK